jgi:hypothetical protein
MEKILWQVTNFRQPIALHFYNTLVAGIFFTGFCYKIFLFLCRYHLSLEGPRFSPFNHQQTKPVVTQLL